MKMLYRHSDGRLIEMNGDSSRAELWQLYPQRVLLETCASLEASKDALPAGFELDPCAFTPPCPKCGAASTMSLETGMYECQECGTVF